MLKVAVLVSGGGTNLQAILDAIDSGRITNAEVSLVISNNPNAYALERAKNHGIEAVCISPKEFENREEFHKALLKKLQESGAELIVLAGYLVAIPPMIVEAFPNRIINIHRIRKGCVTMPKIKTGSRIMLEIAPISTESIPVFANPWAVMKLFMPRVSCTKIVPTA